MPYKCPIKRAKYMQQYYQDNKERIRMQLNYYDPVFKARQSVYNKQWILDNNEHRKKYKKQWALDNIPKIALYNVKSKYGLTEEMFIKLYEKQGGLCLGCDIKLITHVLPEERNQYEDDPNLIEFVHYAVACVDHDHSFDIESRTEYGTHSGDPDSVRGLLCSSCNARDVLDPESKCYIYGDDPTVRETLIKNREMNVILKQWHKEENS